MTFRRQLQTPLRPNRGAARRCGRNSRALLVSGVFAVMNSGLGFRGAFAAESHE
jgi:hypothetical protein